MSLDDLLAMIAARGYFVNLLHQAYDGTWQGSVREQYGDRATYPSNGHSPTEVLLTSLYKAERGIGPMVAAQAVYRGPPIDEPTPVDLSTILNRVSPSQTFRRR